MREEKRCKICPMTLPQPIKSSQPMKSSPSWGRFRWGYNKTGEDTRRGDGDIKHRGKFRWGFSHWGDGRRIPRAIANRGSTKGFIIRLIIARLIVNYRNTIWPYSH